MKIPFIFLLVSYLFIFGKFSIFSLTNNNIYSIFLTKKLNFAFSNNLKNFDCLYEF